MGLSARRAVAALYALAAMLAVLVLPWPVAADEPGKLVVWHAYRGA